MNVEPETVAPPSVPPEAVGFVDPSDAPQPMFTTADEVPEPAEPKAKYSFPISYEDFESYLKVPDPLIILDHFLFDVHLRRSSVLHVDEADPLGLVSDKLIETITGGLNIPEYAYAVIQENIDTLALLYQLMWIRSLVFRQLKSEADDYVNEADLPEVISNLKGDKVAINHLKKSAANFFKGCKEEDLAVVSFDFNKAPSLKTIVPLVNTYKLSSYDIPDSVYHSKVTSLSTLAGLDIPKQYKNKNLKYSISDNPFVFVVNSALLHGQIFVLSFDLQSELTFMTKKADLRMPYPHTAKPSALMPHLEDIVNKKVKMEQYIKEYVETHSGLFQRDPIEMAELLFGLHVYAKDRVLASARMRWANIAKTAMTNDISEWRQELDLWVGENLGARSNAPSNLGWT